MNPVTSQLWEVDSVCKPPPFCHWGNRGTPRSGNLLQVTWLVYQGSMMPREDSRMACVVPLVAGTSQGEDAKWSHPRKRHVVGAWRARDTLSSSSPELDNRVGRCPQGSLSGTQSVRWRLTGPRRCRRSPSWSVSSGSGRVCLALVSPAALCPAGGTPHVHIP